MAEAQTTISSILSQDQNTEGQLYMFAPRGGAVQFKWVPKSEAYYLEPWWIPIDIPASDMRPAKQEAQPNG